MKITRKNYDNGSTPTITAHFQDGDSISFFDTDLNTPLGANYATEWINEEDQEKVNLAKEAVKAHMEKRIKYLNSL